MPKETKYIAKIADAAGGRIDYTSQDDAVWRDLVAQQQPNVDRFAADVSLQGRRSWICHRIAFHNALMCPPN